MYIFTLKHYDALTLMETCVSLMQLFGNLFNVTCVRFEFISRKNTIFFFAQDNEWMFCCGYKYRRSHFIFTVCKYCICNYTIALTIKNICNIQTCTSVKSNISIWFDSDSRDRKRQEKRIGWWVAVTIVLQNV